MRGPAGGNVSAGGFWLLVGNVATLSWVRTVYKQFRVYFRLIACARGQQTYGSNLHVSCVHLSCTHASGSGTRGAVQVLLLNALLRQTQQSMSRYSLSDLMLAERLRYMLRRE
jgi:hypothetical protein